MSAAGCEPDPPVFVGHTPLLQRNLFTTLRVYSGNLVYQKECNEPDVCRAEGALSGPRGTAHRPAPPGNSAIMEE
jgi:hypothetical protein